MSVETKNFRLGLLVIGSGLLLLGGLGALGAGSALEKKILVESYLDESVVGLDKGAPVKFRGVNVGRVEEIELVGPHYSVPDSRVRLVIALFPRAASGLHHEPLLTLERLVTAGTRVRLASQGLTGGVYLEIDTVDPKSYPPPPYTWKSMYPYLPSMQSTNTRLIERVENILASLERAELDKIGSGVVKLMADINKTVKDLGPVLESVRKQVDGGGEFMTGLRASLTEDVIKPLKEVLTNVDGVLKDLRPAIQSAGKGVEKLPETMASIQATVEQLSATLRRVDRMLAENDGSVDEALDNLRVATQDLRELTGQAKRYPASLILGEPPPKAGTEKR